MYKNIEEDIIDSLTENTVTSQELREELLELENLVTKILKKYEDFEISLTLPIKCIKDLRYFEKAFNSWSDPAIKALLKIFRKQLQRNIETNSDTLAESIERLLRKLFDDSFVIRCYWKERHYPADIYKLESSVLIACVYVSLEEIWPNFSEIQFEYVINKWLKDTKS